MGELLSQGPIFIVTLLVLMGVVITIHELGHYLAGRLFGAAAESFSIGFGKSITEKTDSRGTRWRINRFPLGGFVKFIGEHQTADDVGNDEAPRAEIIGKAFTQLTPMERNVVAVAGPFANFLLAIVLFGMSAFANGKPIYEISVSAVEAGQPAAKAGFEVGDKLVRVNGKLVNSSNDVLVPMRLGSGDDVSVDVDRNGAVVNLTVVPERQLVETGVGTKARMGRIGLGMRTEHQDTRNYNPLTALGAGVIETWDTTAITVQMLSRMLMGKESIHNLSGPVGIGDIGRRVTNQTLGVVEIPLGKRIWSFTWQMVHICALVSIGIGLFNLLPLPVLDGGHVVFNTYEAITGKMMPEKVMEYSLRFGLVVLLGLAVLITIGDIGETGIFDSQGGSQP